MSRYSPGQVVKAYVPYYDKNDGLFKVKVRPMVVIDVVDGSDNVTVLCTGQTHKSEQYEGILVPLNSDAGKAMGLDRDSFIYCDKTITLANKDILRQIGTCPFLDEIIKKSGYTS